MTIIDALGGIVVTVLAAATIVTFAAVIAATVLVTNAVHTEERRRTLTRQAPGRFTRLARTLLAVPDYRVERPVPDVGLKEEPAQVERRAEPSRR
jgi:hypothetical protein